MQSCNFHSHCTFCDGRSEPEEFVCAALAQNFRAYGFSSHSPLPFETGWNMSASDMPAYLHEIARLKEKYRGRIEIYAGLEIDYLDETYNASIPYFRSLPLDYRIGSLHFIPWQLPLKEANMNCIDGCYKDFAEAVAKHYGNDIRLIIKKFFELSMRMVEAGGFDVIGHLDKIYMNGSLHPGFDLAADWYRKPLAALFDLIAEKERIVEINTKNLRTKNQTYPHMNLFGEIRRRNIPVVVNSDCHYTALVNDGRAEALALLKEAGFRSLREPVGGVWTDVAIE
ncbi:MAG: histidinol-phosphatase [Tannerella sp.]|jgi:histidinol-phosphatase (PHP family)|nr:histidinol-phosphatase [Tannerella sp.]